MSSDWRVEEGEGWIAIPGLGEINPRRDGVGGGRQYFTIKIDSGELARVTGEGVSGGPETWFFEFDQSFLLADSGERCLTLEISLLADGRYAVKHRAAEWPSSTGGGW